MMSLSWSLRADIQDQSEQVDAIAGALEKAVLE